MTIQSYIEHTRKIVGRPNQQLTQHYKFLFNLIKKHTKYDLPEINMEVIYSSNKTAELLYNFHGKTYLIYDQYLGQSFNMLNRIYFNAAEQEIAQYYCFKLLAEEFQISGDSYAALIFALAYRESIDRYDSYKKDSDLAKRTNYTTIQELFVIAHEIAHYLLAKSAEIASTFAPIRENILTLVESYASNVTKVGCDSYLKDRHSVIYGNEDSYKDYLTKEQIGLLESDLISDFKSWAKTLEDLVRTDDNLIVEIFCDEIAVQLLIEICSKEFGMSVEDILDATYVGLMNLRLIAIINKQVLDYVEQKTELDYFIKTSQIRLMRYRNKATHFYSLLSKDSNPVEKIHKKLTATNERYSAIISDQILFGIDERLNRTKSKIQNSEYDFEKYQEYNKSVDELLRHVK